MRLDWKAVLGIAVTVLLLWWALGGVDFGELWTFLRRGDLPLLLAAVAVATSAFLIRAARWKSLLHPLRPDIPFHPRFAAVSIGFMANNVLPARVGEFARAYALSRIQPVSASGAFGTLVVERALDGITLLGLLLLAMAWPTFPADGGAEGGVLAAAIRAATVLVAVLLGGMVLLLVWPRPFVAAASVAARLLPEAVGRLLVDALHAFLDALGVLRSPGLLLRAVAWTLVLWLWHGMAFWLGMLAFDIRLDYVAALFTQAVVGFGVALPSAPGFIGTFHAAAEVALSRVYGIPDAQALAFAFGFHFGGWVPITAIGLVYVWRLGLSFREVEASEARVEAAVEAEHGPGVADVEAPAKVNLVLRVLRRDPETGYHDLETVFQGVGLADRLRVEVGPGEGVELEVVAAADDAEVPDLGPPGENLVTRAAQAFLGEAGIRARVRIRLAKAIPAGAGLGGGSSDAAATLRALTTLLPGAVEDARLRGIAAGLGSDVPFFLETSPTALGEGRGERLTSLPPLPSRPAVVVLPGVHVATGPAYGALAASRDGREPLPRESLSGLREVAWSEVRELAANDFESVVPDSEPRVAQALEALRGTAAEIALLSGSGGAVFGVFSTEDEARGAAEALRARGWRVVVTRTLEAWPAVEVLPRA